MFRIYATISTRSQKTYLSAAPDVMTAIKDLEQLLQNQSYSFVIDKVERASA